MTRAISLLCVLLMLSACTGDESAPSTTTASTDAPTPTSTSQPPPPTSSTTSTSTTTSSTTTEAVGRTVDDPRWLQDEFPEFDMTVDDPTDLNEFTKLVEEFFVFRSWIALHPQREASLAGELAANIAHPEGRAYENLVAGSSAQIEQGFRLEVPPSEQTLAAFWPEDDGSDGRVRVTLRELSKGLVRWLDLDTETVQREVDNAGSVKQVDVEFRQLPSGDWRVWDVMSSA